MARQIVRLNPDSAAGFSFWANNGVGRMFEADETNDGLIALFRRKPPP